MRTLRFPVLTWRDYNRIFTASLLDEELAAAGSTRREAMNALEEALDWSQRNGASRFPSFKDVKLDYYTISLRPQYRHDERVYACNELMQLRVPCVWWKNNQEMHEASLPTLQIRFHFHAAEKLKPLVEHYVREKLGGLAPRSVARYLMPAEIELDEVLVRLEAQEEPRRPVLEQRILEAVAEALDDRKFRRHIGRPFEREREIADLSERLTRERSHILLVGEPGTGKTSILAEAVRRCVIQEKQKKLEGAPEEQPPRALRFWLTQAGRIVAGMKYLGMWQERMEDILQQLSECNGVLCFEALLDLVRLGGANAAESIAAFLVPYMQRGEVRIVAECTPMELDACRRRMPAFVELFQVLRIPPFDRAAALNALDGVAGMLRQNTRVAIDFSVVAQVHRLFTRFRPYDAFPGQASAFLKDLFLQARRGRATEITAGEVVRAFIRKTGLPELFLRDELPLRREDVMSYFQSQVIGQPAACDVATGLVLTFKAGLNDPQRPLGVFLFCGPTGVGKTELARALARYFFGHGEHAEERLVRLDMSEYSDGSAASRLVSAPDGSPSELIQEIRRQPFAVVLLDEIEKASPEVFDVLMGLFDEGRLADPYGRITHFNSAVLVLTSNLGADRNQAAGFQTERLPAYQHEAMKYFRPEFFNRLDGVVTFDPLQPDVIRQITEKELHAIARREAFKAAGLSLEWTPELIAHLSELGYDRRYGARPLQRSLEKSVVAPLSRYLVSHPQLRDTVLKLTLENDGTVGVRTQS